MLQKGCKRWDGIEHETRHNQGKNPNRSRVKTSRLLGWLSPTEPRSVNVINHYGDEVLKVFGV